MKNISSKLLLALLCAVMLASIPAYGQTAPTSTTISAAMTAGQSTITLASGTGITAQSTAGQQINTGIYVDREFMWITTLISGTTYNVQRGKGGTQRVAHASGATVLAGPLTSGPFFNGSNTSGEPTGACTATSEPYLPRIYVQTGHVFNCSTTGGTWFLQGVGSAYGGSEGRQIQAFCTGTAGSAETEYLNGAACSGATTATARYVVQNAGVIGNLRVSLSAAGKGGSGKDIVTVNKNGSATTITCSLGTATSCSDLTHSVAVAAGDVIQVSFVSDTTDTAANVGIVLGVY